MNKGKILHRYNALLNEAFQNRIEQKTGWGKIEIKAEFQASMLEAMEKIMDEEDA